MIDGISDELVKRMVDLTRSFAKSGGIVRTDEYDNIVHLGGVARGIVADLPPPVDPDLLEARKIASNHYQSVDRGMARQMREGRYDKSPSIQMLVKALARGRELASS